MGSQLPITMPLESSIAPTSRLDSLVASLAILSRRQTTAPVSTRREPSFAALGTIASVASVRIWADCSRASGRLGCAP
jgi:hypothetical protein